MRRSDLGGAGLAAGLAAILAAANTASAQQVTVGTPLSTVRDSFYENHRIGWGYRTPGFSFSWPGGATAPAVGGFAPGSGASGGFAAGPFSLGFSAGQGSSRSISSVTPSLTLTNGVPGYLFVGRQRPFVTRIVPVVGGGAFAPEGPVVPYAPAAAPAWQSRLAALEAEGESLSLGRPTVPEEPAPAFRSSTADRGAASVSAIRAARAAEDADRSARQAEELAELVAQADAAEAEGRPGLALVYLRQAAKVAEGEPLRDLQARIAKLSKR